MLEAEIDRIRAGFDRGVQLRPMAGRTLDFGFAGEPHARRFTRVVHCS
jgi:hypothetical protein